MCLTARNEGLRTKPYLDPAGIPTVCYGETELPMRAYTADECGAMLRQRMLKDYAPKVAACLPGIVDKRQQNALAAFIDAAYNAGPAAVCRKFAPILKTQGLAVACNSLSGWYVTAKGKRLNGLVRRREEERALCLKDTRPPQPLVLADYQRCVTVNPGTLKPAKPGIKGLRNHPEIS